MACTNLAAKIEENARRLRDVINVFHHIKQIRSGKYVFKSKNSSFPIENTCQILEQFVHYQLIKSISIERMKLSKLKDVY